MKEEAIRIVEFVGSPGCGKSTISKVMVESEQGELTFTDSLQGKERSSKGSLAKHLISNFNIGYYSTVLLFVLSNNLANKKGIIVYLINLWLRYRNFLKQDKNEILIVDQGFVQSIASASLGRESLATKHFQRVLKYWEPMLSYVMVVNCELPAEEAARRLVARNTNGGRLDKLRGEDLLSSIIYHKQLLSSVPSLLIKCGVNMKTITVDTTLRPEYNSEVISRHIVK